MERGLASWLREHGLSIVLLALFLATMVGQVFFGWIEHNETQAFHGEPPVTLGGYMLTGHVWEATGENWESEFLQMAAFVLLTTILYQRGSAESKRIGVLEEVDVDPRRHRDRPDVPFPVRRGGVVLWLYERSLGLLFLLLFFLSAAIHALGGLAAENEVRAAHGLAGIGMSEYLASATFWFESFQNWQSEFLSLTVMVLATIWLRQRGSAESKPVHAAHSDTGKA